MINMTKSDLEKLERINSGRFGSVYKGHDGFAYKIYHQKLYDNYGNTFPNPNLKGYLIRLSKIKRKKDRIKQTDFFNDYVYIDGKFGGIKLPYYNGKILFDLIDKPFELKYDISKKLLNNSIELTNNCIYPLDYKLNNIIYVDDEVKIIDLDDIYTKSTIICNIFYERNCISGLNDTIRSFFSEFSYKPFEKDIYEKLLVEKSTNTTNYQDISNYLEVRNKDKDFIIIDSNTNLDIVLNLIKNHNYKIVFLYDSFRIDNDYFNNILFSLKNKGIELYDFIYSFNINKYFCNTKANNIIQIENDKVFQKK